MRSRFYIVIFALGLAMPLAACDIPREPAGEPETTEEVRRRVEGKLFGEDFLTFRPNRSRDGAGAASGIGVNTFLWRASLDTLSFMPLTSADPFGGVIISDWYSPPESADERFKVTVYILDRQLRADGIRAAVFRQVLDPKRGWVDVEVATQTGTRLEDTILTRARQLRIAQTDN